MCYAVFLPDMPARTWAVFTGATLFIGEAGRTDLPDRRKTAENAGLLANPATAVLLEYGEVQSKRRTSTGQDARRGEGTFMFVGYLEKHAGKPWASGLLAAGAAAMASERQQERSLAAETHARPR